MSGDADEILENLLILFLVGMWGELSSPPLYVMNKYFITVLLLFIKKKKKKHVSSVFSVLQMVHCIPCKPGISCVFCNAGSAEVQCSENLAF